MPTHYGLADAMAISSFDVTVVQPGDVVVGILPAALAAAVRARGGWVVADDEADEADEEWNDTHRPPEYDGPLDLTPPIPDPDFVHDDESEEGRLPLPD